MQYRTTYESPIGTLTLASSGEALTGLWVEGQKHFGGKKEHYIVGCDLPVFTQGKAWLDKYFAGACPSPHDLPLRLKGTPFQVEVWRLLLELPYGATTSYGALAQTIADRHGSKASPQAVGNAVGRNPIMLIVPCHRVIGADGSLTGYAGGMERKKWLLEREGVVVSRHQ